MRRGIIAGREPDTVEAGALVERVPGQRGIQMSQEGGVSQFYSELGSHCSCSSGFDYCIIH